MKFYNFGHPAGQKKRKEKKRKEMKRKKERNLQSEHNVGSRSLCNTWKKIKSSRTYNGF